MNANVSASANSLSAQTARAERRHAERPHSGEAASTSPFTAVLQQAQGASSDALEDKPKGPGLKPLEGDAASGGQTPEAMTAPRTQEGPPDSSWWSLNLPGMTAFSVPDPATAAEKGAEPARASADEHDAEEDSPVARGAGPGGRARARNSVGRSSDGPGSTARGNPTGGDAQKADTESSRDGASSGGQPGRGSRSDEPIQAVAGAARETGADPSANPANPGPGELGLASGASTPSGGEAMASAVPDGGSFASQLMTARADAGASAAASPGEVSRSSAHALLQADDPGFPGQVALKVAEWSASGVHQATLDLHPAELGPIQIHIDLEGLNASIRFGATHERTRALLDDALPALALALQSDGLSLAASQITDVVKPAQDSAALAEGRQDPAGAGGDPSAASSGSGGGQAGGQAPRPPRSDVGLSTSSGRIDAAAAWQSGVLPDGSPPAPAAALFPGGRMRLDLYA